MTMIVKTIFVLLMVFYSNIYLSAGDDDNCVPSFVRGITVTDELILEWNAPPGDCEISYYLIRILSRGEESSYTSQNTSMDVGFLPTCEDAQFTVIPISTEDVEGSTVTLHLQMPVHKDENVTIDNLRVVRNVNRTLLLEWELDEKYQYCTNRFRVLIYNEDYNEAVDIYVQSRSTLLQHIMPCEDYTFGVRAIFSLVREGPIFLIRYTTLSHSIARPTVQSVELGATTVQLDWQLEVYTHNRCPVTSIVIESNPHFAVSYPVHDDPDRPIVSTKISNLEADTMYFLNVTVINTAGPSDPFLVAIQTLPES